MAGVELLIILSVAAFYFAVVARCKWFDFLVPDSELGKCFFKECQRFVLTVAHFICKFKPIVCLNTLNGIGKLLYYMLWKLCGRVCTLLLERLEIPESAVLVNEGILIVFLSPAASPTKQAAGTYFTSICPRCPGYSIFS